VETLFLLGGSVVTPVRSGFSSQKFEMISFLHTVKW